MRMLGMAATVQYAVSLGYSDFLSRVLSSESCHRLCTMSLSINNPLRSKPFFATVTFVSLPLHQSLMFHSHELLEAKVYPRCPLVTDATC